MTFTDQGAAKLAVTDPVGQQLADESVSVVPAQDSKATPPEQESIALLRSMDANLQLIVDILTKARL